MSGRAGGANRLRGPYGQEPESGTVTVINARTFDPVAVGTVGPAGTYTVHVLGPQEVKLLVDATVDGRWSFVWHDGAADFRHGRIVPVPAGGLKTVDVMMPVPGG